MYVGAAGILAGYPLDTVKVRIQTQDISKGPQYTGTFQCMQSIFKNEGVSSRNRIGKRFNSLINTKNAF